MASCDINRHHGLTARLKATDLKWVCADCLAILESPESSVHTEVIEIERRRRVAPFVMPLAGLAFMLAVVSEVLFYWH